MDTFDTSLEEVDEEEAALELSRREAGLQVQAHVFRMTGWKRRSNYSPGLARIGRCQCHIRRWGGSRKKLEPLPF